MGMRVRKTHEFRAAYDDHTIVIAAEADGPVQFRISPVGIERLDGIDITPQQARMLSGVFAQAAAIAEGAME